MTSPDTVIDDLSAPHPNAANGAAWKLVSDHVMGGVSRGVMTREVVGDRPTLRLKGEVSLENNGGFIQIALDLDPRGGMIDARSWAGIEMDVNGNDEDYNLHLRTRDVKHPWQSYRASFRATPDWHRIRLPFADFTAHRIDTALDLSQLRRIGIAAIGRTFNADIAIAGVRFF